MVRRQDKTNFSTKFITTGQIANERIIDKIIDIDNDNLYFLHDMIAHIGGHIYNNGLFKIHTYSYLNKWTKKLKEYFEEEIQDFNLYCFASNWQGNMYCVDELNQKIVYFDPATMEYFESEISLDAFFNEILLGDEYDILFSEYFEEARCYLGIEALQFDQSIGHKIYLHLGGEDDVKNMEVVDTEVLWELQYQVANRINEL